MTITWSSEFSVTDLAEDLKNMMSIKLTPKKSMKAKPVLLSGLASTHETRGLWVDSWSGQMPRFQAQSPVQGVQEAADQ